tara:strand:- start:136 stop:261 length:126 start_codon:yes stop_codon:yes gene_type:complete
MNESGFISLGTETEAGEMSVLDDDIPSIYPIHTFLQRGGLV